VLGDGARFAGYEIVALRGEGAMATTYRALRRSDQRVVALKIPRASFLQDPSFVVRFLQEASLCARLKHPFIVRLYESGEERGIPFMAMEYLDGLTLKEALAASGRLALRRALQVTRDVADALEHAHGCGVVHRDLKPDNIMLRSGACLKVLDFGIAKVVGEVGLTSANTFIGSPAYSAPEMIDSSSIDHRADLYSLGVILYEMLAGRPPFTGASAVEVLLKHRTEELPGPETLATPAPKEVWRLIENLTAKDPARRLPDARSVRVALEMLLRR
jgi:eukaryotic-like serine/threonine-protein kinase